ncbi:M16 family metallopeptidase [Campylobacter ureolyticus]|uniref:Insulinase family protein n=1 Tax=Campylobacter ureolyticus TaxID=827 RepID=A0A9Q4PTT0_9BACT|nr:M16 family metallopeptidase [Campylobacter ureolyticus]MCZ6160119.1 insulinase family protein [Campylobacter ureolyticus]MCZ6163964.1 insulinase family protein [Campylobacter ureolyticus]MCZ6165933.1 insulinase family protein [Campylobacter ureolyticus]MCZ6167377.1 insulinase family protein [Campylobacter ureolyticus]
MKKIILILSIFLSICFGFENDENLKIGKLDNGFSYYLYKNQTPKDSISLILYFKVGSSDELENEKGIAHFVEHMAFNGTKDYTKNDLIKALESLGVKFGADLNAATSFNETIYKLDIKKENLDKALSVLSNMGFKALFEKDDLEAEKGVIIEEERNRKNAYVRIMNQGLKYFYPDSIYASRLPIGDMSIIKNATPALLKGFYNKFYTPNNAKLIIVGDFNENETKTLIKKYFENIKNGDFVKRADKNIGYFNDLVIFNPNDEEIANNSVSIMFEDTPYKLNSIENLEKEYKNRFISKMFSLLNEKRKSKSKTLLTTNYYDINLYNFKKLNSFYATVIKDDVNASLSELISLIKTVQKNGFNKDDFLSAKKELLAQNLANFEKKQKRYNSEIISEILNLIEDDTTFLSPKDEKEISQNIIDKITLDEINKEFKNSVSSSGVLVNLTTKKPISLSKDEFKILQENAQILKDDSLNLPKTILEKKLANKSPINSNIDKNLIYKFEFENGAKVYFKEINTNKDTIYFKAFKKGGLTNFDDIINLNFAINISNGSGIGKFNDYEVRKITAGQMFEYKKFIDKTSLGYSGNAQVKDFENLLKAFFTDFENPKIDDGYLKRYQTLALDLLAKNLNHPDYKFEKEFNEFYFNNSYKMRFLSKDDILNLDKNNLENMLKKAFLNAGEYDFVFVGDMSPKEFIKISKNYIGNLSADKNQTFIKDDGIRQILGRKNFTRKYLQENSSKNSVFINSYDLNYTPKNALALSLGTDILNILLREKIREEDSMVYGIYAHNELQSKPYQEASISIYFTSDVKNINTIVKNVKNIINLLKTSYDDEKELKSVKLALKVKLEKLYQTPNFWLNQLSQDLLYEKHFYNYDEMMSLIDSITLNDIKRVVNLAYNLDNFIVKSNIYKGAKQ